MHDLTTQCQLEYCKKNSDLDFAAQFLCDIEPSDKDMIKDALFDLLAAHGYIHYPYNTLIAHADRIDMDDDKTRDDLQRMLDLRASLGRVV